MSPLRSSRLPVRGLVAAILASLLAAAFVVVPASAQEAAGQATTSLKIAVVDLDRIALLSQAGKQLQAQLEAFQREVQAEAETRAAKAREIRQRIADGINSLSEEKLAELQKQYEDEGIAIRRYRDDKQREGQKIQEEGLRKIEEQLEPVFEAIRAENGFDLILNASVPGVVIMASERADITEMVVERLNAASAPAGS
ncbi:MAG: OmpH family outer membrane protein [Acidobacteriota bacterium]